MPQENLPGFDGPRVRDTSGDKWQGCVTDDITVADELAYDALPETTRHLAEKVLAARMTTAADGGYSMGYDDGKEAAKSEAEKEFDDERRSNEEEEERLSALVDEKNDELRELKRTTRDLEEENERMRRALQTIASAKIVNLADAATVAKKALAA